MKSKLGNSNLESFGARAGQGTELQPQAQPLTGRKGSERKSVYNAKAYSAASATSPLAHTTIARREPTEHDVQLEILFCGRM